MIGLAQGSSQTVSSVKDAAGDTFHFISAVTNSGNAREELWVANGSAGNGNNQLTVGVSASVRFCVSYMDFAWNSANTYAIYDAHGTGSTATNTSCTDAVTTTRADELVVLGCFIKASVTAAGQAPTTANSTNAATAGSAAIGVEVAATTGTYHPVLTFTSNAWAGIAVAVRPIIAPSPPTSMEGYGSDTTAHLFWQNPNAVLLDDWLHYGTHCGSGPVSSVGVIATATVTGLSAGETYCFWTVASNRSGNSSISNYALVTVPDPSVTLQVAISVHNTQASGTGTYQQMVRVDSDTYTAYINSNWSNVQFAYPNGTAIQSWIEANGTNTATQTTVWVRLFNIAAASTQVVYMDIYSTGTHLLSLYGPAGEGPSLSATYGWNDNGARVFSFYDNFSGTTLASTWVTYYGGNGGGVSPTTTVNNGVTITTGSGSNAIGHWLENSHTDPAPTITEMNVTTSVPYNGGVCQINSTSTLSTNATNQAGVCSQWQGTSALQWNPDIAGGTFTNGSAPATSHPQFAGVRWNDSTEFAIERYGYLWTGGARTLGQGSQDLSKPTTIRPAIGIFPWSASNTITYQWVRDRVNPPNSVMPTVTFLTPSAPTGFTVTAFTTSTLTLGWTNPPGAMNDTLYWGTSCSALVAYAVAPIVGGSLGLVTSFTATTAAYATTYCFALSATNLSGQGAWAFTNGTTLPNVPSALTFSNPTSTGFTVGWTNSLGTVANVSITIGTSCAVPALRSSLGLTNAYTASGLSTPATYCVSVRDWSTSGGGGALYGNYTLSGDLPQAPTGLKVTGVTSSSVSLSWTPPPGTVLASDVFYGLRCDALASVQAVSGANSTIVTTLSSSTTYCFSVAAVNASGVGTRSAAVIATTGSASSGGSGPLPGPGGSTGGPPGQVVSPPTHLPAISFLLPFAGVILVVGGLLWTLLSDGLRRIPGVALFLGGLLLVLL